MFDFVTDIFHFVEEWIEEATTNPWFLLILFTIAFLDSVVPIVPSEFTVIAGGAAAAGGELISGQNLLALIIVILLGLMGAYLGDSLAYLIGNKSEKWAKKIFFRGEKGEKRLIATDHQIRKRGGLLLVTARFIPGGRTAMTMSCGLTNQPFLGWFTRWDLLATTLWASYAAILGFSVSSVIEKTSTAVWLAFGVALTITVCVEIVRYILEKRKGKSEEEDESLLDTYS